ncbi:hypothetical protein LTR78_009776 [Recurvomyces mirabilis]|uniref:Uncharacterized protein n=1 Tax=Recurvomyces mirabilis TaxID=574656 RepID=A0AAE0TNB4_9PEZI|nr:hypothetical protein LTR78_009776 [Recurvomyces mirabilis]
MGSSNSKLNRPQQQAGQQYYLHSTEANKWKSPLGQRQYEKDIYRYGVVEADRRHKRRRRVGAFAALAGAG